MIFLQTATENQVLCMPFDPWICCTQDIPWLVSQELIEHWTEYSEENCQFLSDQTNYVYVRLPEDHSSALPWKDLRIETSLLIEGDQGKPYRWKTLFSNYSGTSIKVKKLSVNDQTIQIAETAFLLPPVFAGNYLLAVTLKQGIQGNEDQTKIVPIRSLPTIPCRKDYTLDFTSSQSQRKIKLHISQGNWTQCYLRYCSDTAWAYKIFVYQTELNETVLLSESEKGRIIVTLCFESYEKISSLVLFLEEEKG